MKYEMWKQSLHLILQRAGAPGAGNVHDSELYNLYQKRLSPIDAAVQLAGQDLDITEEEIAAQFRAVELAQFSPDLTVLKWVRKALHAAGWVCLGWAALTLLVALIVALGTQEPVLDWPGVPDGLQKGAWFVNACMQALWAVVGGAILLLLGEVAALVARSHPTRP